MPRASEYLLDGYTYHLTHRCHDRRFLLRFARDRDVYREWLRTAVVRHRVPVFGFCITHNHVHVLARADDAQAVSRMMHLASGATAKQYNLRKERTGAVWEHPYHCTIIENGRHLLNCLVYINMNMVRAGAVAHPREWKWCCHDELMGVRQRYRVIDKARLMDNLGVDSEDHFRQWYTDAIEERIAVRSMQREAHWTDSLAVGSRDFVRVAVRQYGHRRSFETAEVPYPTGAAWAVRESPAAYGPYCPQKRASNASPAVFA